MALCGAGAPRIFARGLQEGAGLGGHRDRKLWKGGGILRLESGEKLFAARVEPTNATKRGFSVSELRDWLHEHHTKRRAFGKEPTERDDCEEAKRKFPGVSREVVRAERRKILTPDLLRAGRRPPVVK